MHLGLSDGRTLPVREEWARLATRELQAGVSLLSERYRLLEDWAREQGEHDRERLGRIEEALPLIELVAVGLPVTLMLLVPLGGVLGLSLGR